MTNPELQSQMYQMYNQFASQNMQNFGNQGGNNNGGDDKEEDEHKDDE